MPVERTPARNGDLPVLGDNEEIRLSEPRVKLFTGQDLQGEGVLHLTTCRIVWLNSQHPSASFAIDYPCVTLHAVSLDKESWPEPCLYCQLTTEETDEHGGEDDEPDIPELRFVPADAGKLQEIFTVFSDMSALNPDAGDEQEEDSSEEEAGDRGALVGMPAPGGAAVWEAAHNDAAMEDAEVEGFAPEGDVSMEGAK
uniref:Chloride conductance regulatory protein ICln n=1 Tax=Zooxanthella nutricula TaxID=1333877 RepID=A0A7S2P5Q4_9DINO|mmetsp:Transcript_48910/g.148858  ORF Transcript_48910/g.148858 Transcript_48910/m.148858 type:complete len:198 (+) Transcript_48910:100-693(+)